MTIILVSGSGIGAGKSTLAGLLSGGNVLSLADGIRFELMYEFPGYPWLSKEQKSKTVVVAETGKTIREMLIQRGQERKKSYQDYWTQSLLHQIDSNYAPGYLKEVIAIDDIRMVHEVEYLREAFGTRVVHIHVDYPGATSEEIFENDKLQNLADYIIRRGDDSILSRSFARAQETSRSSDAGRSPDSVEGPGS